MEVATLQVYDTTFFILNIETFRQYTFPLFSEIHKTLELGDDILAI